MRRKEFALAVVLGIVVLLATAAAPMLVAARPAFEIPVTEEPEPATIDGVSDAGWESVPAASLALGSAGAAVPAADDTTIEQLDVQAARTDERLYLRLSWADATRDASTGSTRAFADAVAVQLPADPQARPPIAMGGTDNPVNVWYWGADGASQELLAGGPGSTTRYPNASVRTDHSYGNGEWTVLFSRPLDASGDNRTTVPTDANLDVAVAAWNGSNDERSGQKSVSEWYYLALGPGPQGPPYEAILWVVAGLGIVITTLVTIEGVRRTRGA